MNITIKLTSGCWNHFQPQSHYAFHYFSVTTYHKKSSAFFTRNINILVIFSVIKNVVTFKVLPNSKGLNASEVVQRIRKYLHFFWELVYCFRFQILFIPQHCIDFLCKFKIQHIFFTFSVSKSKFLRIEFKSFFNSILFGNKI